MKRTPVGDYSGASYTCASGEQHKGHKVEGKVGGTLRRGWTAQRSKGFDVKQEGDLYTIELVNPVEYASYVEYGHRTADHKGWVPGKFIMTKAEAEIQALAPKVLEAKIKKYLEGVFN